MKHIKLIRKILVILTVILACLAFYTYRNAPVREVMVDACPICPAFSIEKVKDTSTAKSFVIASVISGCFLAAAVIYSRKTEGIKR